MDLTILAVGLGYVGKVTESKPIYVLKSIASGTEEVATERFVEFLTLNYPHLLALLGL